MAGNKLTNATQTNPINADNPHHQNPPPSSSSTNDHSKAYPLHYAASTGDIPQLLSILSASSLSQQNKDKNSRNDSSNTSRTIVNSVDGKGRTPLHWAARNGHTDICRLFIVDYKADPNQPSVISNNGSNNNKNDRGVTPLELAVWQGHYTTTRLLLSLGANPHRINWYGCGLAHWCALSPAYGRPTSDVEKSIVIKEMDSLVRLFATSKTIPSRHNGGCDVKNGVGLRFDVPNGHGQTPLHKAAYAGNLPVLAFLVGELDILDECVDDDGNTAADCAERAGRKDIARWVRRFANPKWRIACRSLGLTLSNNTNVLEFEQDGIKMKLPAPPSLKVIRKAYFGLARRDHPNSILQNSSSDSSSYVAAATSGASNAAVSRLSRWYDNHKAYCLLRDWWFDPEQYDDTIRTMTRNQNLIDCPLLLTNGDGQQHDNHNHGQISMDKHHSANTTPNNYQNRNNNHNKHNHVNGSKNDAASDKNGENTLSLFTIRLGHLLQSPNYKENGLAIDRLPRLYGKSYPGECIPNPKEFKCRKLIHLIKKYCNEVCRVEYGDNSALLWAV